MKFPHIVYMMLVRYNSIVFLRKKKLGDLEVKRKLRQMADNIHGTIYLSELESELISTPYFYRLHDVYQNSTVYMTYPANRTKRYEHSVGTMELASSMLYSAISNSDNKTKNELFKCLRQYSVEILDLAILQSEEQNAPYFTKCRDQIGTLFEQENSDDVFAVMRRSIHYALENGCFNDSALEQFQFYPMDIGKNKDNENLENIFLYRCLLQSARIVALFHDVGHPPYSHIIEDVLNELYEKYSNVEGKNEWQKKQLTNFKNCIGKYAEKNSNKAFTCQAIYSKKSEVNAKLHERVGLSLLQSAINEVIPQTVNEIIESDKSLNCKIASALYYILVVEFSFAILVEKNVVFKSFHGIVDGIVDADRLDYIMRDSINSGVDWGKIPYKRIINLAKLMRLKKNENNEELEFNDRPFIIAYPKKVADDIEDLLLIRYKIFARINFHHRCMKTSVAFQSAVKELAQNYLESTEENKAINPDINILWNALGTKIGDRKIRVIQWNDSWLISILHKALVKLNNSSRRTGTLKDNLEEILLNKKRYYSLLKRGADSKVLIDLIFKNADLTEEKINELQLKEYQKYLEYKKNREANEADENDVDILKTPGYDAVDSLKRIAQLKKAWKGDLEALFRPLPLLDKPINETIDEVLEKQKSQGKILDFKCIINKGKTKTGIPEHTNLFDEIYLYEGDDPIKFDDRTTLRNQIEAIERTVLWVYVYIVPGKCSNISALSKELMEEMGKEIGLALKKRYDELFGSKI